MRFTAHATHLECVASDHNKYYRCYALIAEDARGPHRLVRNWGRRGSGRGQWLVDPARGAGAVERGAADLVLAKEWDRGYVLVHQATLELEFDDDVVARTRGKQIPASITESLHAGFDDQWAAEALSALDGDAAGTGGSVALFGAWGATLAARPAARAVIDALGDTVRFHDLVNDRCALACPPGGTNAVAAVFGMPIDVAAGTVDDEDTLRVALRLYTGTTGPYARFATAVRDARRLFRRTPAATKTPR